MYESMYTQKEKGKKQDVKKKRCEVIQCAKINTRDSDGNIVTSDAEKFDNNHIAATNFYSNSAKRKTTFIAQDLEKQINKLSADPPIPQKVRNVYFDGVQYDLFEQLYHVLCLGKPVAVMGQSRLKGGAQKGAGAGNYEVELMHLENDKEIAAAASAPAAPKSKLPDIALEPTLPSGLGKVGVKKWPLQSVQMMIPTK